MYRQIASAVLVLGLVLQHCSAVSAAEISEYPRSSGTWMLIAGEIEVGDFDKVHRELQSAHTVLIDSAGGNVVEAMRIGRLLRRYHIRTFVPPDGECLSACFLIWVAGVQRQSYEEIGIHRPYFESEYFARLSAAEARSVYAEVLGMVEPYLAQMGAPTNIVDQMTKTRSTEIMTIKVGELEELIGEFEPSFNEWVIAQCGDLTDEEWSDYYHLKNSITYKKWQLELSEATDPARIAVLRSAVEKGRRGEVAIQTLSDKYKQYLIESGQKLEACLNDKRQQAWAEAARADAVTPGDQ